MKGHFDSTYKGLTVLVTGHTGFKGSWLSIWLRELGATVIGFSLDPQTEPSNFAVTGLASRMIDIRGNLSDLQALKVVVEEYKPDIIFHLAAQAIVLESYMNPVETFGVNAQGTIHILEAARVCPSVRAVVVITTDKCYENNEWIWGYRELDRLGGNDPYSASKAMAELAIASYRKSFFVDRPAVASARAGNVIGGGDFSQYRILPDTMKALMGGLPIQVRNPASIRPWIHVLDPLSGYLWLGANLLQKGQEYAQAWNFGPLEVQGVSVEDLVQKAIQLWGKGDWINADKDTAKPEMGMLRLNWDKAAHDLLWKPTYNWEEAVAETVGWFKAFQKEKNGMYDVCVSHIREFAARAASQKIAWAEQRILTPVRK